MQTNCYNTSILKIKSVFFNKDFTGVQKQMISRDITIKNSVGLHTRPATFFIQKANSFKSSIWIQKDDRRISAKSLLGVLSMGITEGTTITIIADGPDEVDAINGLEALVESLV